MVLPTDILAQCPCNGGGSNGGKIELRGSNYGVRPRFAFRCLSLDEVPDRTTGQPLHL